FEITGQPARPELLNINMSRNAAFKPVNIPIDFFWGVSDDVMIGITHETGLKFNTGPNDGRFRNTYNDVGFGAVIFLAGGRNYEVDLDTGVPFHQLSPDLWVGGRVGVLGRANVARKVALVYDPGIYLGFNRRDRGNGDRLFIPFWVYFQPTEIIAPFVGTEVDGPFRRFGDNFEIPLEGGVLFTVARGIHIGGLLRFPDAFGKNGTLDRREIGFLGQFRF
ncbi:MAG TPA: hypothetical protein VNW92_19135, partial [Polyangiaceae bacterium]|nr:hypothetical protein [Polyangiaceae bacterium]